ncbi:MAG TPA: hypothetical protein DHV65_11640, partial [Ktedonobacter sp.]|nr:hypothetical protein [Ktedonobacter sp.]
CIRDRVRGDYMATLQQLLSYLEAGYTLQNVRGEILRPLHSTIFEHWKPSRWGSGFDADKCNLADVRRMGSIWDWGVVFVSNDGKTPYCLTGIDEIEAAIAKGVARAVYGNLPE